MTRRRAGLLVGSFAFGGLVLVTLGPFPQPDLPGVLESLPHAIAYAVATWVALSVAQGSRGEPVRSRTVATVAVSMVALGVVLELAQRLVGRDVEIADAFANAVGVLVAVGGWGLTRRVGGSATVRGR